MESTILQWNKPLGRIECPYAYRWVINLGLFSIRLHKWVAPDDTRAMHDHPYEFMTVVLWGGYDDHNEKGIDRLSFGSIRFRRATYKHYVVPYVKPTWTLLITGPFWRQWGFWKDGKFIRREKWFQKYGHICD